MKIWIRRRSVAVTLIAAALTVTWLAARTLSEGDDRSVIIVRAGSLLFDNGTTTTPGTPWTKDSVLDEWKPADADFKDISGFAVSFDGVYTPSACQSSTMTGDHVDIEFTKGGGGQPVKMGFGKRRAHWGGLFGKHEPKLEQKGNTLTVNAASGVPELVFADTGGHVSRVTVLGSAPCDIPAPPSEAARLAFRVLIQPKKQS